MSGEGLQTTRPTFTTSPDANKRLLCDDNITIGLAHEEHVRVGPSGLNQHKLLIVFHRY